MVNRHSTRCWICECNRIGILISHRRWRRRLFEKQRRAENKHWTNSIFKVNHWPRSRTFDCPWNADEQIHVWTSLDCSCVAWISHAFVTHDRHDVIGQQLMKVWSGSDVIRTTCARPAGGRHVDQTFAKLCRFCRAAKWEFPFASNAFLSEEFILDFFRFSLNFLDFQRPAISATQQLQAFSGPQDMREVSTIGHFLNWPRLWATCCDLFDTKTAVSISRKYKARASTATAINRKAVRSFARSHFGGSFIWFIPQISVQGQFISVPK